MASLQDILTHLRMSDKPTPWLVYDTYNDTLWAFSRGFCGAHSGRAVDYDQHATRFRGNLADYLYSVNSYEFDGALATGLGMNSTSFRDSLRWHLVTTITPAEHARFAAIWKRLCRGAYRNGRPGVNANNASYNNPYRMHEWARKQYAALGAAVAEAVRLARAGKVAYFRDLEDHMDKTNCDVLCTTNMRTIGDSTSARVMAQLVRYFPDVTIAHCGHLVARRGGAAVTMYSGELVCEECSENRDDYVWLYNGDLCPRDEAYLWHNGEWYTSPEPSHDEDDSDGDPDARMSYDTNILDHLEIDDSFETSPTGDFHMGLELETLMPSARSQSDANRKVREVRDELGDDYLVGKNDGSIVDDEGEGIEWVTQPTSLAKHINKLSGWSSSIGDMVAWDAGSCGLHVHIDARAFTPLSLGKMIQFYNAKDNADFIRSIAGRHPAKDQQAASYANWDLHPETVPKIDLPTKALRFKPAGNRYAMINLTNLGAAESKRLKVSPTQYGRYNTVEVRIFRATLRKARLLAQVEFAHACVMFCRVAGFQALTPADFLTWLSTETKRYPSLARFFSVRPHKHGTSKQDGVAVEATEDEVTA